MKIGRIDQKYWTTGHVVIGVDEVGRGALAGPVAAGAVVLNPLHVPDGVDDSKKLSPKRREFLHHEISHHALAVAVSYKSAQDVDSMGIRHATLAAMHDAVLGAYSVLEQRNLLTKVWVLVDGLDTINLPKLPKLVGCSAVVKGDQLSWSIAAASIMAKVERDKVMTSMDTFAAGVFKLAVNKGYGTADHVKSIHKYGISNLHRKSFLRKIVGNEQAR